MEYKTIPADRRNWTIKQWRDGLRDDAKTQSDKSSRNSKSNGEDSSPGAQNNSDPGGRNNHNPKKSVTFSEPAREDTPGAKRSVTFREDNSDDPVVTTADDTALVGGIEGFYTCDGGCDRATVTNHYADAIIKGGGKFTKYDEPDLAYP